MCSFRSVGLKSIVGDGVGDDGAVRWYCCRCWLVLVVVFVLARLVSHWKVGGIVPGIGTYSVVGVINTVLGGNAAMSFAIRLDKDDDDDDDDGATKASIRIPMRVVGTGSVDRIRCVSLGGKWDCSRWDGVAVVAVVVKVDGRRKSSSLPFSSASLSG